jgi:hypothetical protein
MPTLCTRERMPAWSSTAVGIDLGIASPIGRRAEILSAVSQRMFDFRAGRRYL